MNPITITVPVSVADLAAFGDELQRLTDEIRALRITLAVMQYARPNPPMPLRPPNSQVARTVPDPEDLPAASCVGPARAPLTVSVSDLVFDRVRGARVRKPRRPG